MPASLAILLPHGLHVSGVVTWALSLSAGLAERGHDAALVTWRASEYGVDIPIPTGVRRLHIDEPFPETAGDERLPAHLDQVRELVRTMSEQAASPVALCPTLLADACGLAAALTQSDADLVRTIGVLHADNAYDRRVLMHYEPIVNRFVGVSSALASAMREATPSRSSDVIHVPNGVAVDAEPLFRAASTGPLRLLYAGRLEEPQKRCAALIAMSDALKARGVPHVLRIVGEGPSRAALTQAANDGRTDRVRIEPPVAPNAMPALMRESDALVLPSRYEGLSVVMLEAMASGCAPIVTRVRSGAAEVIEHGRSGVLVDVPDDADARNVGERFAEAIAGLDAIAMHALGRGAHARVAARFSLDAHIDAWSRVIDDAAGEPARRWPLDRPAGFTSSTGAGATVAPGTPERVRALLGRLGRRRVLIHGAGRHTIELASVLAAGSESIVAISDDDPSRWGRRLLGWPIIDPRRAPDLGVTDVILSSSLHADAMWARRGVFERVGITVHRVDRDVQASPAQTAAAGTC